MLAGALSFWSSVVLTGNRTIAAINGKTREFWSSVVLTGNRTRVIASPSTLGFGAVSF